MIVIQLLASESQSEGSGASEQARATLDSAMLWLGGAGLSLMVAFVFDKLSFKWPLFAILRIPFVIVFLLALLVSTGLAGLALLS